MGDDEENHTQHVVSKHKGLPRDVCSPLCVFLCTTDWTSSSSFVKLTHLSSDADGSAYRQEAEQLTLWCRHNLKTEEMLQEKNSQHFPHRRTGQQLSTVKSFGVLVSNRIYNVNTTILLCTSISGLVQGWNKTIPSWPQHVHGALNYVNLVLNSNCIFHKEIYTI